MTEMPKRHCVNWGEAKCEERYFDPGPVLGYRRAAVGRLWWSGAGGRARACVRCRCSSGRSYAHGQRADAGCRRDRGGRRVGAHNRGNGGCRYPYGRRAGHRGGCPDGHSHTTGCNRDRAASAAYRCASIPTDGHTPSTADGHPPPTADGHTTPTANGHAATTYTYTYDCSGGACGFAG